MLRWCLGGAAALLAVALLIAPVFSGLGTSVSDEQASLVSGGAVSTNCIYTPQGTVSFCVGATYPQCGSPNSCGSGQAPQNMVPPLENFTFGPSSPCSIKICEGGTQVTCGSYYPPACGTHG
jgi:hypothetical protein